MALGPDRSSVMNLVMRTAFTRVALGLALGVPLAIGAGKLLAVQLYGMTFWIPGTGHRRRIVSGLRVCRRPGPRRPHRRHPTDASAPIGIAL